MASSKTAIFFEQGTPAQFDYVLSKYQEALEAKANSKSSKPETLIKLDKWYQNELPKKIQSRGKEGFFLTHDEIVQCIKWKLARGQFRPRLKDLVQMNTPRVVMQETKKAFRQLIKRNDIESAIQAMSNLKGVGPAMASAVLAAGAPQLAPFMADECLLSLPEIEGIDYTLKEYLRLVEKTKECVDRLNSQGSGWTPHKVELAVWTHYVARDIKPELLEDMPGSKIKSPVKSATPSPTKPVQTELSPSPADTITTNGVNGVHTSEEQVTPNESADHSENSNGSTETDAASANGDSAPTQEKEEASEQNGGSRNGGVTEDPGTNGSLQNGDDSNSSTTKEETFNGESVKRPLETEDSDLSEAKRLKEEAASVPIQAN